MQTEQRRHQYLKAMGIPSWLPRRPLAGARPSADWVWQFRDGAPEVDPWAQDGDVEDDAPVAESSRRAGAASSPTSSEGAGRTALLDSLGAPEAPAQSREPAPVAPEVPTVPAEMPAPVIAEAQARPLRPIAPQAAPEFKLAFLPVGDCLLIDALPPQSRSGLGQAHLRLAMALLRALGQEATEPPRPQMLPWPAFTSRTLDQGWEQAQLAVQRKLDLLLERLSVRYLLLLGDTSAQLVLGTQEAGDGMRGVLFSPRSRVRALASASLTEMLQVPGCKREVWRDLQPLIEWLADG